LESLSLALQIEDYDSLDELIAVPQSCVNYGRQLPIEQIQSDKAWLILQCG